MGRTLKVPFWIWVETELLTRKFWQCQVAGWQVGETNTGRVHPKKIMQPLNKTSWWKSCKLSTKKITQPLHKKVMQPLRKKIMQPPKSKIMEPEWLRKKNHATRVSEWQKSRKLSQQKSHATSPQKILKPLHKNIARIAKCCPENITSVVKCVKFHFPKKLRK